MKKNQTVIMVQIENEIGMLLNARDYHPDATKTFNQEVPARLIQYLLSFKLHQMNLSLQEQVL